MKGPGVNASGIGKALARKLGEQGINVVLVAIDDGLLSTAASEMQAAFPDLQFRKVCLPSFHVHGTTACYTN